MQISSNGYIALAVSLVVAFLIDYAVLRLLLETLRPAYAHVFLAGRISKLAAALVWAIYIHRFWYPEYLGAGQPAPPTVAAAAATVLGILLLAALVTSPRLDPVRGADR